MHARVATVVLAFVVALAVAASAQERFKLGPTFIEPIGFAMDRRMLMGVKERAERARRRAAEPRAPAVPVAKANEVSP